MEETKNLQSTKFAFLLSSSGQKIVLDKHTVEEQYLIPRLDCKMGGCNSQVNSVGVKIHGKETTAPVFVPRIWKSCVDGKVIRHMMAICGTNEKKSFLQLFTDNGEWLQSSRVGTNLPTFC